MQPAQTTDRKNIETVSSDRMTAERQTVSSTADQLDLMWYIPFEFWEAVLHQDAVLPDVQRDAFYDNSRLRVKLLNSDGEVRNNMSIDMPLNELFIPRLCNNGKPAHVSWHYCPWGGERLPE